MWQKSSLVGVALYLAGSGMAVAQSGKSFYIGSPDNSTCINSLTDNMTVRLVRIRGLKEDGFFTNQSSVAVKTTVQLEKTDNNTGIEHNLMDFSQVQPLSNRREIMDIPIEQVPLSRYALYEKVGDNISSFNTFKIWTDLIRTYKPNDLTKGLLAVVSVVKSSSMPAIPGLPVSQLGPILNISADIINKLTALSPKEDKLSFGFISYSLSDAALCDSNEVKTGYYGLYNWVADNLAKGVSGILVQGKDYCFEIRQSAGTYELFASERIVQASSAPVPAAKINEDDISQSSGRKCPEAKVVSNPYVIYVVTAKSGAIRKSPNKEVVLQTDKNNEQLLRDLRETTGLRAKIMARSLNADQLDSVRMVLSNREHEKLLEVKSKAICEFVGITGDKC